MQHFVIACGGTGGHLSPGIAVAEELQRRGHECSLLVSRKDVDSRLASKYSNLRFVRSPGRPMSLHPAGFTLFVLSQLQAIRFAFGLMRPRPRAVIAFGGFTSMGVVLAARLKGVPVALHEANRRPGRAIRLLRRMASRLYLPEGVQLPGVPMRFVRYHGYPVRREIRKLACKQARRALNMPETGRMLLVLGGSQGAASLNDWARKYARRLCESGVNLCCVTGLNKGAEEVWDFQDEAGNATRARFLPFSDQMAELLSAATVAVSRAGAGTIAECCECLLPTILVPYPHAADNHQEANANFLEQQGGSIIVDHSQLDTLYSEVMDLVFNDWLLERMGFNLRQVKRVTSSKVIADDLEHLNVRPWRPLAPEQETATIL